jgi:hypothetical protein
VTDGYNISTSHQVAPEEIVTGPGEVTINLTNNLPYAIGGEATTPKEAPVEISETAVPGPGQLITFDIGGDKDLGDSVWIYDYTYTGTGTLTPIYAVPGNTSSHIIGFTYQADISNVPLGTFDATGTAFDFDALTYRVTDGYNISTSHQVAPEEIVTGPGEVTINLTNQLPLADGGLAQTLKTNPIDIKEGGVVLPPNTLVFKLGSDADGDPIWIDSYTDIPLSKGTLTPIMDGVHIIGFIYTPPDDLTGTVFNTDGLAEAFETFTYKVTDGFNVSNPTQLNPGEVQVDLINQLQPRPVLPVPPLPQRAEFKIGGCPALMNWLAKELGVGKEQVQIYFTKDYANSMNIEPCKTCARLKDAAAVLGDADGSRMAALAAVVNEVAPPDVPPSPEQMILIAATLASHTNDDTQYAAAGQWLDAMAQYVGILNSELGYSKAESVAFADKYVAPVRGTSPNVAVYVESRLAALSQ